MPEPHPRHALTGSRIRERRAALGLRQSDLAQAVGISASYLNLIEHNRRKIGGKLLVGLARVLEVEPVALSEGADAAIIDALQQAARDMRPATGAGAEVDKIDEMAGRFPGWTGVLSAQQKRISNLEAMVDGLQDRLTHDPILAEGMHEMLSSVAAIRSTAEILVREPDIDPQWRTRFHRNLNEEAERLSLRATGLLAHFEDQGGERRQQAASPEETVEAMLDAAGHHFPAIEQGGAGAIAHVIEQAAGMEDAATRELAEAVLHAYAKDAERLPLAAFLASAKQVGFDPARLLPMASGDAALVLRRLASLPTGGEGEDAIPQFGLAVCDAAGALVFRRRVAAFSIPRFGAGCPLWPLYSALTRPMVPETVRLTMPSGAVFQSWAVSQPKNPVAFGGSPVMEATMLLRPISDADANKMPDASGGQVLLVGSGCHVCPREDCHARRVNSLLG